METKQLGQSHKMHMQLLFKACMYRQYWTTASTILATKTKAKTKTFFHLKYETFGFLLKKSRQLKTKIKVLHQH